MIKRSKFLAFLLGTTMLFSSTMAASAKALNQVSVLAPIYSMNITDVVLPTSFSVALVPDGVSIKADAVSTQGDEAEEDEEDSTNQVVSLNYGIVNRSSKDKRVTLDFSVTSQSVSGGTKKIQFASDDREVVNAADGKYILCLTAIPGTDVTSSSNSALGVGVTADDLKNVNMTIENEKAVSVASDSLIFDLKKAVYTSKSGLSLDLSENDTTKCYDLTALNDSSVAGFTFGGSMSDGDWSKLTENVQITVSYSIEDLYDASNYGVSPMFSYDNNTGVLTYDVSRITAISGFQMYSDEHTKKYNGLYRKKASSKDSYAWAAAVKKSGKITFSKDFLAVFKNDTNVKVDITYTNEKNKSVTRTIDVKF